jgi:hypothetical protein
LRSVFFIFFAGVSDRLVCFHCGGVLFDIRAEEKGWEEHAKWSPSCSFLTLVKGKGFIHTVQKSMKIIDFVDNLMKQEPAIVSEWSFFSRGQADWELSRSKVSRSSLRISSEMVSNLPSHFFTERF